MICHLCSSKKFQIIHEGVRDNQELNVIKCKICDLVTLDKIEHINEAFYQNSGMHKNDIKINDWQKETSSDDKRRYEALFDKIKNKDALDFGSGNGGFLKLIKKVSNTSYGIEIEKKFQPYFKNYNLNVFESIDKLIVKDNLKFNIITAFHVFEHLKNPIDELIKLKSLLKDDGEIIIEVPNSDDALISFYKSKAFKKFTYWSQHFYLFNEKNLKTLAKMANMKVNWVEQIQRYPLSNHLYWLSEEKPGGHNIWSFLDNKMNLDYVSILRKGKMCDTLLISVSKR